MDDIIFCSFDWNLLPEKQTGWSVCWDMKAAEQVEIWPGEVKLVPLWVKSTFPVGWYGRLYARSSSPIKRWFTTGNNVGIVDADYRGQIFYQLLNFSKNTVVIEKHERLCQLEIAQYYITSWLYGTQEIPKLQIITDKEIYADFENKFSSERWAWWFGSTGK